MALIYHITTKSLWDNAQKLGSYEAPSLQKEGFIHCSQESQVAGVLERYFSGQSDLVKLSIETDLLESRFVFEWSPSSADTYPHIYGSINLDAVKNVTDL